MNPKPYSSIELKNLEREMIKDVINGYIECKTFFSDNTDYRNSIQLAQKASLLQKLSSNFFRKYEFHPLIESNDYAKEILKKDHQVIIKTDNDTFIFPNSFVRYMDRLNNVNTIPIQTIDVSELDELMKEFSQTDISSIVTDFDQFLEIFNHKTESLIIPLRERDNELLYALADPNVLFKTNKDRSRIESPEIEELVEILGYSKKQYFKVTRAYNFLIKQKICSPTSLIMNPTKFGFLFTQIEYGMEHSEQLKKIKKFIYWDFPIKGRRIAVACVPSSNINGLLSELNFVHLTNWYWNINLQNYIYLKSDPHRGWASLKSILPDFLNKYFRTTNYMHWDLTNTYKDEFSTSEIALIKNITKKSIFPFNEAEGFSEDSNKKNLSKTRHIADQLISKEVYQLYPSINYIDLKNIIIYKIVCKNKEFQIGILHSLLSMPITHMMTNENENLIIGYFHIPSAFISEIVDKFVLLKLFMGEEIFLEYEIMPKNSLIQTFLPLENIEFAVRNGSAYLVDDIAH